MSNESEQKKSKRKFINAFDATVILLVCIIFSVIGLKIRDKSNQTVDDTKKFSFTIEAKCLDEDFKNKISIGDEIRDSAHGYSYGKVSKLKIDPAKKITEDNVNGCYVLTDIPGKNDLQITVECQANISDEAITIDGNPIRIGKLMPLKSKGYVVYGYIINMEVE